jgi:hypothetical protein
VRGDSLFCVVSFCLVLYKICEVGRRGGARRWGGGGGGAAANCVKLIGFEEI